MILGRVASFLCFLTASGHGCVVVRKCLLHVKFMLFIMHDFKYVPLVLTV